MTGFAFLLVGLALFAGLLPSFTDNYADQRLMLVIASWGIACFCFARIAFSRHQTVNLRALGWALPLVLVFLSGELYQSTYRVEPLMFASFFLATVLLGGELSQRKKLDQINALVLVTVASLALLYGLIALLNYAFALSAGNTGIDTVVAWGVPNIRYWSHLASWLIPLLVLAPNVGRFSSLPLVKALFVLTGALWWWIVFTTVSRGSVIGLVAGASIIALLFGRSAITWLHGLLVQVFIGGLLWGLLTLVVPWLLFDLSDLRGMETDSSGRVPLWKEAWQMSVTNFPFGMGPQSWLTHNTITEAYADSKHFGHPHNMYLLWAAEYGWVCVLALLFMVIGGWRALWARRKERFRESQGVLVLISLTASVVAACFHALVSAVFLAPASMLVGFVIVSLFWARVLRPFSEPPSSSLKIPVVTRALSGLFLVIALAVGPVWINEVWRYYQDNMEDRLTYKGQGSIYSPRFWSHGDFPRQ